MSGPARREELVDQAWYENEEAGVVDEVGDIASDLFASYENQEGEQQEQAMKKMLEDEKLKRKQSEATYRFT